MVGQKRNRPLVVRVELEKLKQLKHRCVDNGETVANVVRRLLDEHLAKAPAGLKHTVRAGNEEHD